MERQSNPEGPRGSPVDDAGLDDETEFSSVEDVGPEPSENPAIDDV
jgi:hypothetical protein